MDAGTPGRPSEDAWLALVAGVLETRTDEATRRFDAELATAAAGGELSEQSSQRLQARQRASVQEVAEHVRTVLPAVLRAVDHARRDAISYAEETSDQLIGTGPEPGSPFPEPSGTATAGTATMAGGTAAGAFPESRAPEHSRSDVRRASSAPSGQPRTLEERRPRLLVADLTDTSKDRTS